MSKPLVCAILLVNGREAMVRRAVASFRAQSYERKQLFMVDSGDELPSLCIPYYVPDRIRISRVSRAICPTIGSLRNFACRFAAAYSPDIICHFDSDDVSHPQRIAEQVALLQASGADCVGYYEAPFWDTRKAKIRVYPDRPGPDGTGCLGVVESVGETWLYRDPARKHVLGASMAYWRKTWERRPFDDINTGEDTRFAARCKTVAVSGVSEMVWPLNDAMAPGVYQQGDVREGTDEPRIVCGIHGGNTSGGYDFTKRQQCFTRAPQFDDYCGKVMQL